MSRSRILVLALVSVVAIAAVATFLSISKDRNHGTGTAYLNISVTVSGVSADDVEAMVVRPLEVALKTTKGVKHIMAQSSSGSAAVLLELDTAVNTEKTVDDVRGTVQATRSHTPRNAVITVGEVYLSSHGGQS